MRLTRVTVLPALCVMLVSCGGSSGPGTINGNWSGTLTGTTAFSHTAVSMNITATLNQTNPPNVDVTNFNLSASCLRTFTPSATFSSGVFKLHVVDFQPFPFQNAMDLQGNLDGNTITGSWMLTPGVSQESCEASGTFKMTRS